MRRTPQEKKRLSYERDRRNKYGEAPHASRKNIPLRKALRNRANRHLQEHPLRRLSGRPDADTLDEAESLVWQRAPRWWRKYLDAPLGEIVEKKKGRRREMQENGGRRVIIVIYRYVDGKLTRIEEMRPARSS